MVNDIKEKDPIRLNEIKANNEMVKISIFNAVVLFIIHMLYVTKVFALDSQSYLLMNILFPFNIIILVSTAFWKRTKHFYSPKFKYFLVFSSMLIFFILNTITPKHALLTWTIPFLLASHYYDPKLGKATFIATLVMMLVAMYLGLFVGEADTNLLTSAYETYNPQSVYERYLMLNDLLREGNNRYLAVFLYYYLPYAALLAIIFNISNALNKRTKKLLADEISISNAKEQIETELNIAHNLQHQALPKELSNIENVAVLAELIATKEVGGDMYDYIKMDDDHIAFLIADVSGKGIPAAMFMMKTITSFKVYSKPKKHPSEILQEVNKVLYDGNNSEMFVTAFLGILNIKTGELEFANAGHNKPIYGHDQDFKYLNCRNGFILGAMDEAMVSDETITLKKDDVFFLYTDGLTEARNNNKEFYSEKKLLDCFNRDHYESIIDIHFAIKDDISTFVNNAEQADDMTYLLFKYQADEFVTFDKSFSAETSELKAALEFLGDCLNKVNKDIYLNPLSIVMDELFSNIVSYAYEGKNKEYIYIRFNFNKTKNVLNLTIIDKGVEFNPLSTKTKKIESKNAKEGGLGILIVKEMVDSISYSRVNEKNIIVLKKTLE